MSLVVCNNVELKLGKNKNMYCVGFAKLLIQVSIKLNENFNLLTKEV